MAALPRTEPNPCERKALYVLVAEGGGKLLPFVMGEILDRCSLEQVKAFQEKMGTDYGRTRIARLVFIEPAAELAWEIDGHAWEANESLPTDPDARHCYRIEVDTDGLFTIANSSPALVGRAQLPRFETLRAAKAYCEAKERALRGTP